MQHPFLRISFILASTSNQSSGKASSCDTSVLGDCYGTYLNNLNVTDRLPPYTDYFTAVFNYLVDNSRKGLRNTCQWRDDLRACLGPSFESCVNREAFEKTYNVSELDAAQYQGDLRIGEFICGDGYKDMIKYGTCFSLCEIQRQEENSACIDELEKRIRKEGFQCGPYYKFMECIGATFTQECGEETSSFVCKGWRSALQAYTHQCDDTLPKC
ncbi:hypothetical protein QR680_003662 [Steinernema hermaphroditum]|uniref:DUF19 domain-containing protein n=1 Tax=Steinernema hermaphroditum TaxID=289476 RepID=A0AA39HND3_9BILA|nr:hypothetical protein QR680_003662 [Steinernema hermaphroditum]